MVIKIYYIFGTLIILYLNILSCATHRILGVFPWAARSHYFLGSSFLKALADAGHDVTIIAPFSEPDPPKNGSWREIVLEEHEKIIQEKKQLSNITRRFFEINPFEMMYVLNNMTVEFAEKTITHPGVQKLLKSGEKFDIVIVTEFMMDGLKVFSHIFDAHLVSFTNTAGMNWFFHNIGLHIPPSAYPEIMTPFPSQMSFFQRLSNTALHVIFRFCQKYIMYPDHQKLIDKYFPGSPKLDDILQNVSLVIVNSHISLNDAKIKVPVIVEVGGIHIKPPKKLPNDLQNLLDSAKQGVIYFSMGSHLNSADLPPEKLEAIMKIFSKRKEKILWKYGEDTLPGKPDNVVLGKWFPQQEILAHPNVKLFITHSGFLSTTETIYHGVPIVGIPIMADQRFNAKAASYSGFGLHIFVEDLTEEIFGKAVEDVISNPKYKENVVQRSKLFRDRQSSPAEEAVYWIEYVIRHNGAKHLRVPYLELRWYQYYLVDVVAFVTVTLFIVFYIMKKIVGFLIRKCCIRRPKLKTS